LSLDQQGVRCIVFEAATDVKELGVGINILPHATRALKSLDLLGKLEAIAIRTRELRYLNHLGQQVWAGGCGLWGGHDTPQLSIRRGRLHGVLWRACQARLPSGSLRKGHRLASFAQDADGVTARFTLADGAEVEERGDVLVGADGIHSVLRGLLHPEDGGIRWQGSQLCHGNCVLPASLGCEAATLLEPVYSRFTEEFEGIDARSPVSPMRHKFAITFVIEADWRRLFPRFENWRSLTRTVRWRLSEDRPPGERIAS
jgi:2-polyprenyl-6-methoxyphenol hydroxylase-like FAD-dependent oxidoreductase